MEIQQQLQVNLQRVNEKIAQAAAKAGKNPQEITLVAVTKTVSAEIVQALISLGVQNIGENRVQDAQEKWEILHTAYPTIRWHMIGHLQRNKVKTALKIFDIIHSIDSLDLGDEIAERASVDIPILLEVNISREPNKHGFDPTHLQDEIEPMLRVPHLKIQGLMGMAPLTSDLEVCRQCFIELRQLKDQLNHAYQGRLDLHHLSMGMSQDYEIAIEEGATIIRVGSALFDGIPSSK